MHTHIHTHNHTLMLLTISNVNFRSMVDVDRDDALEWRRNARANIEGLLVGSPHWSSLHWVLAPSAIKDRLLDMYDHDRFRDLEWLGICGNCEASLLDSSNIIHSSTIQCTLCETIAYCSTTCEQANKAKHEPHCKRVNYLMTCLRFSPNCRK